MDVEMVDQSLDGDLVVIDEESQSTTVINPLHNDEDYTAVIKDEVTADLGSVEAKSRPGSVPRSPRLHRRVNTKVADAHALVPDSGPSNFIEKKIHEAFSQPTKVPEWLGNYIEHVFKLKKRETTLEFEVYCGLIQFISCLYVLPVVPEQLARVGFEHIPSIICTSVTCGIGSIAASFLTDMPFIIAPPTSVSIFYAVSMQQAGLTREQGTNAIIFSGIGLAIIGAVPPISRFITKLIPDCIQASTAVGIGLITALAGATEINLVIRGKYTILDMGPITDEVVIAIASLIVVAAMLHYHVKGAFCSGLIMGTVLWWVTNGGSPTSIVANPRPETSTGNPADGSTVLLIFNLLFLYILTLNGLARSLSDLGGLTKKSGAIPRAGWLFIVCGLTTILSGYFSGPPILISPESAAGIKAGAKTGISTLVCGILFGISTFFYPIFAAVPPAGTAPLLIAVGVVLFNNVKRVDWTDIRYSVPAFCTLFFIPFTYSILRGVAFGYILYIFLGLFTGDMINNTIDFVQYYINPPPKVEKEHHDDDDEDHHEEQHMFGKLLAMYDMDATENTINFAAH